MTSPFPRAASGVSPLVPILGKVSDLMGAGDHEGAIRQLLAVADLVRKEAVACNTLAFLLLQVDRPKEAAGWFEASLLKKPGEFRTIMGLGMAHENSGAHGSAFKAFESAISVKPGHADAWYRRGLALSELGREQESLESLDKALLLDPNHALAAAKRSHLLEAMGDLAAAIEAALATCRALPGQVTAWSRLGDLLQQFRSIPQAISAYDMGLRLEPQDFHCLYNKAVALKEGKQKEQALACAQDALRLRPNDRDVLMLCGNLELSLGNRQAATFCFTAVANQGAARSYPARQQPAKFRAVMLFSPFGGNTPYEDLIKDGAFDTEVFIILPGYRYDAEMIDARADIVVNLVSEMDLGEGEAIVSEVMALTDRLKKPVVNDPHRIVGTDRETMAQRLASIEGLVMPQTLRTDRAGLQQLVEADGIDAFPVIIRHAGTHGGDMMELVDDSRALLQFADEAGEHLLYLTRYVDYSSADGHFRKYRFLFVGEEILPYHLAIGDGWKVHHASTRMGEVEWMREEEAAFLNAPAAVFGPKAMAALDAIRREVGLDYFGIDCGLDAEGRVVVFEVNASMLIHLHNEGFEYKTPHVNRIQKAFEQMLESRADKSNT